MRPSRRAQPAEPMSPSTEPGSTWDVVDSVVVAVDGSDHATRAVRWAAEQAALEHRRLVVVSVRDDGGSDTDDGVAAARALYPDLPVEGSVVPGDPRQVLVEVSEHAHLLVLGSRGRGAIQSMLLGSVSAAVSARAACPVVVCRPTVAHGARRGVVVGADATPESLPVIEFAHRQASLHRLPLTVLHCYWDVVAAVAQYRQASGRDVEAAAVEELRAVLSESVAGMAEQHPDVPVTLTLEHGLAAEALSRRHDGWDLVVVGRHPMTSLGRKVTGSTSTTVVEQAHSTVAVVPQEAGHSRTPQTHAGVTADHG